MAQLRDIPAPVFVDKKGIALKPVARADEHPSETGVKAAENAIRKAGIAPSEIDLVAYCVAGDYDYRFLATKVDIIRFNVNFPWPSKTCSGRITWLPSPACRLLMDLIKQSEKAGKALSPIFTCMSLYLKWKFNQTFEAG